MDIKELFEGVVEEGSKIEKIEIRKAKTVFGDNARAPERQVAIIYTKYGREAHAIPHGIVYDEKTGDWKIEDKLQAIKSLRNPNSWFARFYRMYNEFPKVGMEIKVTVNPRGFTVIKV